MGLSRVYAQPDWAYAETTGVYADARPERMQAYQLLTLAGILLTDNDVMACR